MAMMPKRTTPEAIFHQFADTYASRHSNQDQYLEAIQSFCAPLVNTAAPVLLELGCGPGNLSAYLLRVLPHARLTGIDVAPGMIDIAKNAVPGAQFIVADVRDASTWPGVIHGLVAGFVTPYLSPAETQHLIHLASERMPAGAMIYLATMDAPETQLIEVPTSTGEYYALLTFYAASDLKSWLNSAGFHIRQEWTFEQEKSYVPGSVDLLIVAEKMVA